MPDRITDAELARWAALAEKATPGPWTWDDRGDAGVVMLWAPNGDELARLVDCVDPPVFGEDDWRGTALDNARLMSEARTAVPALVAEVRRLRDENAEDA